MGTLVEASMVFHTLVLFFLSFFFFFVKEDKILQRSSKFTPELNILLENSTLRREEHNAKKGKGYIQVFASIIVACVLLCSSFCTRRRDRGRDKEKYRKGEKEQAFLNSGADRADRRTPVGRAV